MSILAIIYPYRRHIAVLLAIIAAFGFGFYRGGDCPNPDRGKAGRKGRH